MYLGGAVCRDGKTERERDRERGNDREREVRRRAHALANVWKAVDGVTADR